VAPNPDRELADARACIDRGDEQGALKRLDRARQGYVKQRNSAGLEHVLVLADVLSGSAEQTSVGRENLVYAVKQNTRAETRRQAQERGHPWRDPYPDLQAPTEHTGITMTRGVKIAIAIGTALATAALIGVFGVAPFFAESKTDVTLRLVNDSSARVQVRGCDDVNCATTWTQADLDAGATAERDVPVNEAVQLFKVERSGTSTCLPLLVHRAYVGAGSDSTVPLVARLSQATPCPGTAVLPRAAPVRGL